jgi:hypothetical protein
MFEEHQLLNQIRTAALELGAARLVSRRRAAHRCSDVTIHELQTVAPMFRIRLVGEVECMQRAIKPVPAPVAGKHSPGAIAAVGGRRQTDNQHPRLRIAESR